MLSPQDGFHLFDAAADHAEATVITDETIESDAVERILSMVFPAIIAHLGDDDFDFQGLHFSRKDLADRLGIGVGKRLPRHILAAVRVALGIHKADTQFSQLVEFTEFPHSRKGDAIVDLTDLGEAGRIFSDQQNPSGIFQGDNRLSPANALAGKIGLVGHHLLWRNVEGHAHRANPPLPRAASTAR